MQLSWLGRREVLNLNTCMFTFISCKIFLISYRSQTGQKRICKKQSSNVYFAHEISAAEITCERHRKPLLFFFCLFSVCRSVCNKVTQFLRSDQTSAEWKLFAKSKEKLIIMMSLCFICAVVVVVLVS